MPTVYLISGTNRGIGLGIVAQLAVRPDAIVFAGARNPASATELQKLADAHSNVHIIKLTSADEEDNAAAVEAVERIAGRLDVVIANAAILKTYGTVFESSLSDMRAHWEVNVGGPLLLFQKTLPLLRSSPRTASDPPKFIVITSLIGSIENSGSVIGVAPYRNSKASLNHLAREIHFEHEVDGLVAFPLCPGAVDTDMLTDVQENNEDVARLRPNTVQNSVNGILSVIDSATRETHGGKYINYASEPISW